MSPFQGKPKRMETGCTTPAPSHDHSNRTPASCRTPLACPPILPGGHVCPHHLSSLPFPHPALWGLQQGSAVPLSLSCQCQHSIPTCVWLGKRKLGVSFKGSVVPGSLVPQLPSPLALSLPLTPLPPYKGGIREFELGEAGVKGSMC